MRVINYVYALIGILLGLTLGFCASNNLYRAELIELNSLSAERNLTIFEKSNGNQASNISESLSDKEIAEAISQAEKDPNNLQLQKSVGLALYQYAVLEQKTELLPEVVKLLELAVNKNNYDADLLKALGNALFVLSRAENDAKKNVAAQTALAKAVQLQPKNPDLHVDLGLTYYFAQTPQPQAAINAYRAALKFDDKHERALENLINVLLFNKEYEKAKNTLSILERANAAHPSLNNLRIRLAQVALEENSDK